METADDCLDDIVLALLASNGWSEHGSYRGWKSLPWEALDRLHAKGLIDNPQNTNKSVWLTDEAFARGRALYEQMFGSTAMEAASDASAGRRESTKDEVPAAGTVHRFRIRLDDIEPAIWREVELPSTATFWDLHCALNDAMGWEDSHLHAFRIDRKRGITRIGIPDEDTDDIRKVHPGWEIPIVRHLGVVGARCIYEYDFGDGWEHTVTLEAIAPRERGLKYPRCVGGERACPPEDCGGVPGYQRIVALLAGSKDPAGDDDDADELLDWLGDDFDAERFDASKVSFRSAARRLKEVRR